MPIKMAKRNSPHKHKNYQEQTDLVEGLTQYNDNQVRQLETMCKDKPDSKPSECSSAKHNDSVEHLGIWWTAWFTVSLGLVFHAKSSTSPGPCAVAADDAAPTI
eukprot:1143262-Amphidinium_carterae.2